MKKIVILGFLGLLGCGQEKENSKAINELEFGKNEKTEDYNPISEYHYTMEGYTCESYNLIRKEITVIPSPVEVITIEAGKDEILLYGNYCDDQSWPLNEDQIKIDGDTIVFEGKVFVKK